mmetsp:Transcript_12606/g.21098  ORF Transcript_12606/g.21098 Transcript_12606/m.21098 type:complete len:152 (-) Transcript_12606:289-744(-)
MLIFRKQIVQLFLNALCWDVIYSWNWLQHIHRRIGDYSDFIIKLGSMRYLRLNRSIHLSKMFVGTIIIPPLLLLEKEDMYWNKSKAILCAKAKRSSTPEFDNSRLLIVSKGSRDTPSWTTTQLLTSSFVAQLVLNVPDGFSGEIAPMRDQF